SSLTLYAGRTARFQIAHKGTPLTYQWFKGDTKINDGGTISGATTDTLVIQDVSAADEGVYRVEVKNSAFASTATSDSATLTLVQPSGVQYECAVLAADPVAYWRLNET